MAKEVYSKMSQFGTSSIPAMKAASAYIPAVVAGMTNKKIPVSEFASTDDVEAVDGKVDSLKEQLDVIAQREPSTKEVVTVATAEDLNNVQDPSTEVIYKTLDDSKLYIYDGRVFIDVTGHAVDSTVYAASIDGILTMTLDDGVYSVLVVLGSTVTATYSLGVSGGSMVLTDKDGWADVSGGAWRWHMYSYEGHKHTLSDVTDYTVDSSLSTASSNPVANNVIKAALDLKGDASSVADTIELSIDSNTYEVQAKLKKGNTLIAESNKIDLPLETMVVGGSYDSQTKKVVLTLKNGQTVEFSVADLVEGLAPSDHTHVMADITDLHSLPSSLRDGGAVSSSNIGSLQNNSAYSYGYTGSGSYASLDFVVEVDDGDVPNFMVTISATASGTVTVCKYKGGLYIPLYVSAAGGDGVESGKVYQLTCNGDGFALAEYSSPSASAVKTRIGDKAYSAVKIGNLWWTVPNLDLTWTGLTVGDTSGWDNSSPKALYYNDDQAAAQTNNWGLLYNHAAVEYLAEHASLLNGWRVPTKADWEALITAAGGSSTAGGALKATSQWSHGWSESDDGNGTDDYGFAALPGGYVSYGGTSASSGTNANFWTATLNNEQSAYCAKMSCFGTDAQMAYESLYDGFSLRLCRDAEA